MKRMILALVLFIVLALTNSVVVFADEMNKPKVITKLTYVGFAKDNGPSADNFCIDSTIKAPSGRTSNFVVAAYDLVSSYQLDFRCYPSVRDGSLKVGFGFIFDDVKLSSKNNSYMALNIVQPINWGSASGTIYVQPRYNISGGADRLVIKEASLKFPISRNLKVGPDFQGLMVEGGRAVLQPGGVLEYKVSDHWSVKFRYFPKTGNSAEELQPWVTYTF